ncbi:hypothetical protein [Acidovorax sp. SUPP3334]|uniref:hypothetical protein n=1 Tax=Acidovorax sp. SUPP3334 TaxID=2920881 RepID=UPI0023DE563E|nr:hypothetical protein [Acidovorax sp. SUPP3334]GKT22537.1 hypothetical protein AVHM3334_08755 [Acidovorax sp. SUPP3334]
MARPKSEIVNGEKLCRKCGESWPADTEFFFGDPRGTGGLYHCCKACYYESYAPDRRRQVAPMTGPHQTDGIASFLHGGLA